MHVLLDRSFGHPQLARDAGVRAAFGHQREHLALARGEALERVVDAPRGYQLLDERGVDDRGALDDPLERLDEVLHVCHAALQQVADALPAAEEVHRVLDLDVCGENEDRGLRSFLTNHPRRLEPFGRVVGRHPDVHDRELGPLLSDEGDQVGGVAALADDVEPSELEQARQAFAK